MLNVLGARPLHEPSPIPGHLGLVCLELSGLLWTCTHSHAHAHRHTQTYMLYTRAWTSWPHIRAHTLNIRAPCLACQALLGGMQSLHCLFAARFPAAGTGSALAHVQD